MLLIPFCPLSWSSDQDLVSWRGRKLTYPRMDIFSKPLHKRGKNIFLGFTGNNFIFKNIVLFIRSLSLTISYLQPTYLLLFFCFGCMSFFQTYSPLFLSYWLKQLLRRHSIISTVIPANRIRAST